MPVTKSNNSSQEDHGDKLSVEQLNAIDILVLGKTDQETAKAVGVARETVNRWKNENPYFAAELNKQRKQLWGANGDRLRALTTKAVDAIETALDGGDSKAAIEVLKAVGIYGAMEAPSGPVDADLVIMESAKQWAATELSKKAPSSEPILDLISRDSDLAYLIQKRIEELKNPQN